MATCLVVLNNGVIQQAGIPKEVYEKPVNVFVRGFIGSPAMNFFTGTLLDIKTHIGHVSITIPERKMMNLRKQGYINKEIIMGICPEDLHNVSVFIKNSTAPIIDAKIEVTELLGAENILHLQIAGQLYIVRLDTRSHVKQAQVLKLALDMNKVHFFDYKTENHIHLDG